MKKFTILFLCFGLLFTVNAQNYKNLKAVKAPNRHAVMDIGVTNQTIAPYAKEGGVPIGGSMNIYGAMLSGPHQVMYSPEINTVAFIHRNPTGVGAGGSGELCIDFSTNGGDSWTTNAWITPGLASVTGAGCRYPSMTIFNPTGNTNLADARFVANGPSLCQATGSWGFTFEIDATISSTPVTNEYYGSNNGDNTDFHPYSLEMGPDGTAWSISMSYSTDYLEDLFVNKAVYNSGNDQFDWTSPLFTITPDYFYSGADKLLNGWAVAVHPTDPDIIYAVVNCMENGDTREVPSPHVWKTTDGGANWTALDPIDYTAEPYASFMDQYVIYNEGDDMKPYIVDIDAAVDANGVLHVFSEVWSGAADFGYVYGVGDASQSYRHFMDLSTTDGTDWEITYVNDIECESAPWGDVETYYHPQISRNPSGTDIFYTWSETFADTDSLNTAPNLMAAWWNTTDGLVEDSLNLTEGTGAQGICYFQHVSPILIDNGDNTFEVPIVIALIDFASGSDMDPANYMYLTDFIIEESVGVESISKPDVIIYPNPVAEKVFVSKGSKVEMYNILGAKLITVEGRTDVTTIDMAKYPAGTYLLKVYTDNGIVTKKIQKID